MLLTRRKTARTVSKNSKVTTILWDSIIIDPESENVKPVPPWHNAQSMAPINMTYRPPFSLTWNQALFSFRFENYIPAGKANQFQR